MTYFKPTKILTLFNNVLYTVHIEKWAGSTKSAENKKVEAPKGDDDFDPFADEEAPAPKKV